MARWKALAGFGIAAIGAALPCSLALAGDGDPDPTFGSNGRLTVSWPLGDAMPNALAVDAQGRIVVAGTSTPYQGVDHFLVLRLLADGSLDTQFAPEQGGYFQYDFALNGIGISSGSLGSVLRIQDDDRIVVAGRAKTTFQRGKFGVLRLDGEGHLDPTFGIGGSVYFGSTFAEDQDVYALALDASGRIVGSGTSEINGHSFAATFRLTPQGSYDTTFDSGYVSEQAYLYSPTTSQPNLYNFGFALSVSASGKVIVAGYTSDAQSDIAGVLRLREDGVPDATFGQNGRQLLPLDVGCIGAAVALPAEAMLVAGSSRDEHNFGTLFFAKLDGSGDLDTAFGDNGIARFSEYGWALAVWPTRRGGWLMAAGDIGYGLVLIRTDAHGNADPSFGTNGVAHIAFDGSSLFYAAKPALTADGRVVVAGFDPEAAANGSYDFGVMRIDVDRETIFLGTFESAP